MGDERPISMAFDEIAQYTIAKGQAPIKGKLYHAKLDDCWEFWVNATGKREIVEGAQLNPYECYVKFNGWPAGILNPFGGCFAAGDAANEDTFIAALRAARGPGG